MARVEIDAVVRHANGAAASAKGINVYNRGTVVAVTLYSGETGAGTTANPTSTDSEGRINAWVEEGSYDIVVDGVVHPWEAVKGPVVPVGAGFIWFAAAVPAGFLLCDGSQVSQTTYATLYALLGTVYNIGGETAGNFRLPDLRGRSPVGRDAAQTEFDALAETGGAKAVTLTGAQSGVGAHGHGFTQPSTVVSASGSSNASTGGSASRVSALSTSGSFSSDTFPAAGGAVSNIPAANAASSHQNLPPYLVVNYIVRY